MYVCGGVTPVLAGKRIELRAMEARHAPALYKVWSHPQVASLLAAPPLSSPQAAEQLIALLTQMSREEESLRWSILGPGGDVIGSCGYNSWQLQGAYRGEIGCELLPDCWGQGYMREALELVLEFGFTVMGLNRIEGLTHPDNVRAERLFQALGFQREGLLREYRHTEAGFQDVVLYALLRGRERGFGFIDITGKNRT
ncbi:GNAT family N-acetyltransferase [Paenibacillus sp. S150]|uniref:GNAT family N-acetyltransferase n=1 Tax=Paenibacillus sp. S150 TaxID=2749826 RepID=UPI001C586D21|nr:GNAT family protein [Paenibacillus sp. S150]MBW4085130.1 GNAT family N-acetyltransferase [Paenibacillus sp. S150]